MNKLIRTVSLLIVLALCLSLCTPTLAIENDYDVVPAAAASFSVSVPASLPISVDAYGTVTTATNVEIINNSNDSVQVVDVDVVGVDGWTISSYESFGNVKVDSNQIAMSINDSVTTADGSMIFDPNGFDIMSSPSGDDNTCDINYSVKVSPCSEALVGKHVANVIFTVDWLSTYTITYDANGGTFDDGSNTNVVQYTSAGKLISGVVKEVTRSNCTFGGWYTDKTYTTPFDLSNINGDTTVYAKWTTTYYVKHHLQNLDDSYSYTLDNTETFEGVVGTTISPNTATYSDYTSPSKQSHTLDGSGSFTVNYYYKRNNYWLDVNYVIDGVFTGGPDDWSTWPSALSYNFMTVYINGYNNGGGRDYCRTSQFGSTYEVILSNLPSAYYYAGTYNEGADYWNNGTTLIRKDDHGVITENTGLRLVINSITSDMSSYTIVFNSNGGTGTMANMTMVFDSSNSEVDWLTSNAFTRNGYTFAGWATSPDGDVVYSNNARVQSLSSQNGDTVVLYAKWVAN